MKIGRKELSKELITELGSYEAHKTEIANKAHGGSRGAVVFKTMDQSIPNTTDTILVWDGVLYDTHNFYNSAQSSRLTVPAGVSKVVVSGGVLFGFNVTGDRYVIIRRNSANFTGRPSSHQRATESNYNQSISTFSPIIPVSPGDYFELVVGHSAGTPIPIISFSATWFALEVIE